MTDDVEHLFMHLLALHMSSLVKSLFKIPYEIYDLRIFSQSNLWLSFHLINGIFQAVLTLDGYDICSLRMYRDLT